MDIQGFKKHCQGEEGLAAQTGWGDDMAAGARDRAAETGRRKTRRSTKQISQAWSRDQKPAMRAEL